MKRRSNTATAAPPMPMTSIEGQITELRWKSARFEITFCKCFQPDCRCQPVVIWLPKDQCTITSSEIWEKGKATVKLPVWLLTKETRALELR